MTLLHRLRLWMRSMAQRLNALSLDHLTSPFTLNRAVYFGRGTESLSKNRRVTLLNQLACSRLENACLGSQIGRESLATVLQEGSITWHDNEG